MKKLLIASVLAVSSLSSFAGVYSDSLGKCLVSATSTSDRSTLVQWMFAMFSNHPDTAPLVKGSELSSKTFKDSMDAKAANLFESLMTEKCRKETKEAISYEGEKAIETGFEILGQVATKELIAHPNVEKALGGLEKHINPKKFEKLAK